jgi:hypothetical protein
MFICPPNLTHSFHTMCKIIRFRVEKNKLFSYALGIQESFGGQKTHFLD